MTPDVPSLIISLTNQRKLNWVDGLAKAGKSLLLVDRDGHERPFLMVMSGDRERDRTYYGEVVLELLETVEAQSLANETSILDDLNSL